MSPDKQMFVYIMTNSTNRVLYVGVTNDIVRRAWQHRHKAFDGFTARYNVSKLVYYEIYDDPSSAISREKQIKGGSRDDKIRLIRSCNPTWDDLWGKIRG